MSDTETIHDMIIIGAGPAGYTAAIYAARAGRKPLMITGLQPGGQLMTTSDVENYPGFRETIQGPWLMDEMGAQAAKAGTMVVNDTIIKVDFSEKKNFALFGDSGKTYRGRTIIIATGANAKWLGLPVEEKFKGFGVSGCATCDGFFYKDQDVLVIGGGNTAMEEALYLANLCRQVTLIHRRNEFKGEKILQDRVKNNPKIKIIWDSQLVDIKGSGEPAVVEQAVIENVKDKKQTTLDVQGIFVAIGHSPATEIFKGQLDMDKTGYLKVAAGTTNTNIAGVFAAGDVADSVYRQAVTSAGMGCMAALDADRLLKE
ncbi:MAG: thioredoxin-disulfide reductase [Hydrotalea sp.]|nr:thioredoxin-disulfide reductase [Hydrotalea sp.]